jgi:serine protease AprX
MRKVLPIILFFCSVTLSFTQTKEQISIITSASNKEQNSALKTKIEIETILKNERITTFLEANPTYKRHQIINGKPHSIVDIIDNKPIIITTHNVDAAEATRTNFMHSGGGLGLNIEGQGMTVGVWDSGNVLYDHLEFYSSEIGEFGTRVTNVDYNPNWEYNDPYDDHATHVTGTIIAKGANAQAKGMAPYATAVSYNWSGDSSEVLDEVETNGLLISNHSYGTSVDIAVGLGYEWLMGKYDNEAELWDNIHFNNPFYLQVTSAGNDGTQNYAGASYNGYDKLTRSTVSKNNLVVANAQDPGISASGELTSLNINSSSSQGPTDDGRIKPDITGNGTSLYSPIDTDTDSYQRKTGTSMSSPNVAGSVLLLQQYYNSINGSFMKSATLKGLVCHTADDNLNNNGPDPTYGWGLLNVKKSAETILDAFNNNAVLSEHTLEDSVVYSTTFNASSDGPISATICWTDPAGFSQDSSDPNNTIPVLINDLDIVVTGPDGTNYYPWLLNPSSPLYAVKGDNIVDNIENVDIDTPTSGTYTINVSNKGQLTNGYPIFSPNYEEIQNFSLIVTGSNLTLETPNLDVSSLSIWPNPASTKINFDYPPSNEVSNFMLIDIQGSVVYQDRITKTDGVNRRQIDVSSFAKGIYILKIEQGNTSTQRKVVLK